MAAVAHSDESAEVCAIDSVIYKKCHGIPFGWSVHDILYRLFSDAFLS